MVRVTATAAFLLASLQGCVMPGTDTELALGANGLDVNVAQARVQLKDAPDCCADLSQLPYQALPSPSEGYFSIDNNSPSFTFPGKDGQGGTSYLLALELPDSPFPLQLELRSLIDTSVFAPTLWLLDENFQPVQRIGEEGFRYIPARLFDRDSLLLELPLWPQGPKPVRYLVVFSSDYQQAGETVLLHPAKAFARATHTVEPPIADPVARHAPVGLLHISLQQAKASAWPSWLAPSQPGQRWQFRPAQR